MNDTVLGAIIGAAAAILGGVVVQATDVFRRRARRRTFALVLAEELLIINDLLRKALSDHPDDGLAKTTDAFLVDLSRQDSAGHLFVGLVPNLDVLPPDLIGRLSGAHTELRALAALAQRVLERGGSFNVASRETDAVRNAVQDLTQLLDGLCARLMRLGGA